MNLLGIDPACLQHLKWLGLQTTMLLSIDTWFLEELEELAAEDKTEGSEQEVLQEILNLITLCLTPTGRM